jgi:flagellar protein FlaJ
MSMQSDGFGKAARSASSGKIPFADVFTRIKKYFSAITENKRMGPDLLFMITYMASITTSKATRPEIFAYTAARTEYVPAKYMAKVEFFVKRWNYSYVESLTTIAERVNNKMVQSMLNRFANSIESGVPDEDFLTRELATIRSVYKNTYEQGLEMLKKWGDAYIAMLFSGALVGIIIMVSVAIFAPDDVNATLSASYFIVIFISVFGLITMYRSVHHSSRCRVHHLYPGPRGGYGGERYLDRDRAVRDRSQVARCP